MFDHPTLSQFYRDLNFLMALCADGPRCARVGVVFFFFRLVFRHLWPAVYKVEYIGVPARRRGVSRACQASYTGEVRFLRRVMAVHVCVYMLATYFRMCTAAPAYCAPSRSSVTCVSNCVCNLNFFLKLSHLFVNMSSRCCVLGLPMSSVIINPIRRACESSQFPVPLPPRLTSQYHDLQQIVFIPARAVLGAQLPGAPALKRG